QLRRRARCASERPSYAPKAAPRGATPNCETYHRVYQRRTHGIGIMKELANANTIVRHSTSSPLALKTTSRRVPLILRQIQRVQAVATHAQPMIVMKETTSRSCQ